MRKTIATDSNNDMFIDTSGSVAMYTDVNAVLQSCEHAVKTMRGELVLQGDIGMPNFQLIWNGAPNIPQALSAARTALMAVPDVIGISELSAFVQNNVLYYNATIETIYGEVSLGI
jgi:hypothetical protein